MTTYKFLTTASHESGLSIFAGDQVGENSDLPSLLLLPPSLTDAAASGGQDGDHVVGQLVGF